MRWLIHAALGGSKCLRFGNKTGPRRSLFIQVESTPNEHALKFKPGRPVLAPRQTTTDLHQSPPLAEPEQAQPQAMEFRSLESSIQSPLARKLMILPGVQSVFFGADFVTVNKQLEAKWPQLKPDIYATLMDFFASGQPVLLPSAQSPSGAAQGPESHESEVVLMIRELLDSRIRPAVNEDGGDVEFVDFNDETGVVRVTLKGSCRGCSSSTVTLKSGIENMIKHYIPEVTAVEQTLDEVDQVNQDVFKEFESQLHQQQPQSDKK